MRSPWNTNKNKYLTRYSTFCGTEWVDDSPTFPTCEVRKLPIARSCLKPIMVWLAPL
jgi:hypothetical protein